MRKGRPPAEWLALDGIKKRTISLRDIAKHVGIKPPSVSNALKRVGVTGELTKAGQQYIMVFSVSEIRAAYREAEKRYREQK